MNDTEKAGFIYFLQGQESGRVKIGFTGVTPTRRAATIQGASPEVLLWLGYSSAPQSQEKELHRAFSKHRLHGEWFTPADELMSFIQKVCSICAKSASLAGSVVSLRQPWPHTVLSGSDEMITEMLMAAAEYSKASGISRTELGKRIMNDGHFFRRLAGKGDCWISTYRRVMKWFQENQMKHVDQKQAA